MEVLTTIAQVSQASSPFLLALAVWAFATGRVVPRWIYDAMREDRDAWKRLAEGGTSLAERSLQRRSDTAS